MHFISNICIEDTTLSVPAMKATMVIKPRGLLRRSHIAEIGTPHERNESLYFEGRKSFYIIISFLMKTYNNGQNGHERADDKDDNKKDGSGHGSNPDTTKPGDTSKR